MASVETPTMQAFLDAFNAHDVDAIMSFFTDDCVFDMPRGPGPGGRRLVGKQEVRGCDLFEFSDGKISRKDAFWKIVD
jgi:ketosteroid isomerase-like protein